MNKLLIVHDHRIFTDGIRFIIERTTDLDVVGVLHSGREVMPFLLNHTVNIILLDIDLPELSGFEITKLVKPEYPILKILALSMLDDTNSIERMFSVGADGYCLKSDAWEQIFAAIKIILDGGQYFPPNYFNRKKNILVKLNKLALTLREIEIIPLIVKGMTTGEIAKKLFISTRTVETHRKNIYRKVAVRSNIELVHYAKKNMIF